MTAMHVPFVDLKAQYRSIQSEIDEAITTVLHDATFVGGNPVRDFESEFARMYGVKHAIGVANGTDAIYIVLRMLGIGAGDEVITTAMSWISTSETISQTGATPVFVDVDPTSLTINPKLIEGKITSRTRAIIPVHLYGQSAHIAEIRGICEKHKLFLVEDCAQAHFSAENGTLTGKFGVAATFSFYPGKNLGAYGDAGAIITNDDNLAIKCRMFANHGAVKKHEHQMEGVNSRLDTLQAAILRIKLKYIIDWNKARSANADHYKKLLAGQTNITLPKVRDNTTHTFHLFVIRTRLRDVLKQYLEENGVQTAIHYPRALPNLPAYRHLGHSPADFPIASQLQGEILSLPMYPELTHDQIEYTASLINKFFALGR